MSELRIEAVILDMDGLVLDSETGYAAAWRQAAAAMGYELSRAFLDSLSGLHGESVRELIIQRLGDGFDIERFNRLSREYWGLWVEEHGIPVKKGFTVLMTVMEQYNLPFCLATNSRRADAMKCLALAGLSGIFRIVVARDDVERPKPAADIFLQAGSRLGRAMEHCLVLEDSPTGLTAAAAAGAPCLYVPSSLPSDHEPGVNALAIRRDLEHCAEFIIECMLANREKRKSI